MKKLYRFCAAAAVLAHAFFGSNCAADEISIIPNVGYANVQRKDTWNIVSVTVENRGAPIEGTLEIGTGATRQNIVSRNVAIGKGKFLYHLYYYCDDPWEVDVRLRKGRQLIAGPIGLSPTDLGPDSYVCLVVGRMPGLARLKADHKYDLQIAHILNTREMPDSWIGYDFADFLLFTDSDLSRLRQDQEVAVRDWIIRGGRVGVATGKDWQYVRDSFLDEMLPLDITGTKEVPSADVFSALSMMGGTPEKNITVATVDNCPEDSVLYSTSGTPLVTEFEYGRGEILLFSFDPGSEIFRRSGEPEVFWKRTLGLREEHERTAYTGHYYGIERQLHAVRQKLSSIEGLRQISLGALTLIFLVYIAVIGPVDYFVLKRLKRLSWTHMTFVLYVVIFSVFAYLYTYRMKGGDMWIKKFILADLPAEGERTTGTTTMMIFSPQNNTYIIPVPNSTALRPAEADMYGYGGPYGGMAVGKGRKLLMSGRGSELHIPIPIWSAEFLKAEWMLPSPGEVNCSLKVSGNRVTGFIENNLEMDIEKVTLLYGEHMVSMSRIAEGQKMLVDSNLSKRIADNLGRYHDTDLDSYALFMTVPEIWAGQRARGGPREHFIDQFRDLKKSSLTSELDDKDKGILILKCRDFDDGIEVRGWDTAKKESFVYLRKICRIEN